MNFPETQDKLPRRTQQNNFSGLEIYFEAFEIYFSAAEIYFQATEKVSLPGPKEMSQRGNELVTAGKETSHRLF